MVPAIMRCGGVKTPPYAFCKKGERGGQEMLPLGLQVSERLTGTLRLPLERVAFR